MMKMGTQQIYKGDGMNYLEYIIYHNCDKGRIIVRHTQRFFTSYEEAKANAEHWIKQNYPNEDANNFEIYVK